MPNDLWLNWSKYRHPLLPTILVEIGKVERGFWHQHVRLVVDFCARLTHSFKLAWAWWRIYEKRVITICWLHDSCVLSLPFWRMILQIDPSFTTLFIAFIRLPSHAFVHYFDLLLSSIASVHRFCSLSITFISSFFSNHIHSFKRRKRRRWRLFLYHWHWCC